MHVMGKTRHKCGGVKKDLSKHDLAKATFTPEIFESLRPPSLIALCGLSCGPQFWRGGVGSGGEEERQRD